MGFQNLEEDRPHQQQQEQRGTTVLILVLFRHRISTQLAIRIFL